MTVRIALVNNMPDTAFEEAERQFGDLVQAGSSGREVVLERYVLPSTPRQPEVQAVIAERYQDVRHLYRRPPDGLVVTGAEPKAADLADEAYWPELEQLLWWARTEVPAAVLSCLAAHAALSAFDGISRQRLPAKCSGVFPQVLAPDDLVAGLGAVAFPHSRLNDVPVPIMEANGYRLLAQSADAGWTIAAGEVGQCLFVLLQGHPEYTRFTLLREYRRDVRRYLSGQGQYPQIPAGYLGDEGVKLLSEFRQSATAGAASPALMDHFPFEAVAHHANCSWRRASRVLVGNWLQEVCQRARTWEDVASLAGAVPAPSAYSGKGA
jgi:homoserine O-succinyltransferase